MTMPELAERRPNGIVRMPLHRAAIVAVAIDRARCVQ